MDYKRLIIDGYKGRRTTPYAPWFKQQAQIAKRDNFVEFADFFNACRKVINDCKTEIEKKYQKRLHEHDWVLNSIRRGRGVKIEGEIVTDQNDERIKGTIKNIAEGKKFVEERGYKNNGDYKCEIEVEKHESNAVMMYSLSYPDIELIGNGLLQAEQELTTTTQPEAAEQSESKTKKANTGKHQQNFVNYLRHDNKDALMKKLHELLDENTRGREVAKVLEALQEKKYLVEKSCSTPDVIKAFDIQCSAVAINKYWNKGVWGNKTTRNELKQMIDTLP
jgi:hypothetical protein